MKRLIGFLVAVVTAALNYWVFVAIARHFGSDNPSFIAATMLSAVVVHELCHLAVMEYYGIRTYLFFAVVIGGAVPGDPEKYTALHWNKQAAVSIAGVVGNLLLIVLALVAWANKWLDPYQCQQIINLNGVLILWNMIPWGIFDGGRFAKLFFNSISEERDQVWVFRLVSIIGIGFLLIFMSTGQLPMMAMLLVGWGLHFQANHDDPRGSHSKLAMSASAQRNWAGVYVTLVLISLMISVTTPNWCHNRPYPATNTMAAENHR